MRFDMEKALAAARALDGSMKWEHLNDLIGLIRKPSTFYVTPPTRDGAEIGSVNQAACAVVDWIAHVRAIDAKAAAKPADPLEGVVWETPRQIAEWASRSGSVAYRDVGVATADREMVNRIVGPDWTNDMYDAIIAHAHAHARAQLARESAPAQPPALTLEQARAMCRGAGDTVVEAPPRPNYVKPAEMLAWFEASVAVRKADKHMGDAASRCAMQDRDAWTETPDDCTVESEIARLRALGVTPAVLS